MPPSPTPPRPRRAPAGPDPAADPGSDRARILAAARAHFFAEGFQAITMEDLARELGMSKKTLYRHFTGKEAVLDAVIDTLADEVGHFLGGVHAAAELPVARRLQQIIDGLTSRLAPIQPVFLRSLRRHAPRQFQRVEEVRRKNLENHLVPLLETGRQRGEIRADVDPRLVVELLLHLVDGLFATDLLTRLQRSPAEAVGAVLDVFFRGILTRPSRAVPR